MSDVEPCPGCGLRLPKMDGATDPYGGASAACWAAFGEITAKDYSEFRYPPIHRTLVDAYMAQHPGLATPAGRRSVAVHLVGLYLVLELGIPSEEVVSRLGAVFPDKRDIAPLRPVPTHWEATVALMQGALSLEEHTQRARQWAEAVWRGWSAHHESVRALAAVAMAARLKSGAGPTGRTPPGSGRRRPGSR
jgi:hypothetical protein